MDNTGPYLSYAELLCELSFGGSLNVDKSNLTLSAKVEDAGGDKYTFAKADPSDPDPKVGDVIEQLGFGACIIALPLADQIQIDLHSTSVPVNVIENGAANLLHSDTVPKYKGQDIIQDSMDFIDEFTGQFFNKRAAVVRLEGNNTPTMWFPIPIISITELLINSTSNPLVEGEDFDFVAFKGRARPQDDRRNPRIKLNVGSGNDSIFTGSTSRIFTKETLTKIDGFFGFLEPNGNTPRLIKRATMILSSMSINEPIAEVSGTTTGPMKRLKVDLHEQEFFELKNATARGSLTGNPEVNQILAKFKAPIVISGSIELTAAAINKAGGRTF